MSVDCSEFKMSNKFYANIIKQVKVTDQDECCMKSDVLKRVVRQKAFPQ